MDKCSEHDVELLEAGEDATESLEAAKQPLNFVASLVYCLTVVPSGEAIGLRGNDGSKPQVQTEVDALVRITGCDVPRSALSN